MEEVPKGLTFSQFKDWAFLGVCTGMISILVAAIYDLDKSVKALSVSFSEKSGELTMIVEQVKELGRRVSDLERHRD